MMRVTTAFLVSLVSLVALGCGGGNGDDVPPPPPFDAAADASDGGADAGVDAGADAGPAIDAGGPPDAAGGDAGDGVDASTPADAGEPPDAAPSQVDVTVVSAAAWANCMPIVPADPLRFTVTLRYESSADTTTTVSVTSVTAAFDDDAGTTTALTFDVTSVDVPASGTTDQIHVKTGSEPIVASCTLCSDNPTLTYTITFDAAPTVTGTTSFGCTF